MKINDFENVDTDYSLDEPLLTQELVNHYFSAIKKYPRLEFVCDIHYELTECLKKDFQPNQEKQPQRERFYNLMQLLRSEMEDLVIDHCCSHEVMNKAFAARLILNNL